MKCILIPVRFCLALCLALGCSGNSGADLLEPPPDSGEIPDLGTPVGTFTYVTDVGHDPVIYVRMWEGEVAPSAIKPPELYQFARQAAHNGYHGFALVHYPNGNKPDEVIWLDGDEKEMSEVWEKRAGQHGPASNNP